VLLPWLKHEPGLNNHWCSLLRGEPSHTCIAAGCIFAMLHCIIGALGARGWNRVLQLLSAFTGYNAATAGICAADSVIGGWAVAGQPSRVTIAHPCKGHAFTCPGPCAAQSGMRCWLFLWVQLPSAGNARACWTVDCCCAGKTTVTSARLASPAKHGMVNQGVTPDMDVYRLDDIIIAVCCCWLLLTKGLSSCPAGSSGSDW
jgi:hypothetical protein